MYVCVYTCVHVYAAESKQSKGQFETVVYMGQRLID